MLIQLNGSPVGLTRTGDHGDPLVLVHGGFEDRRAWQAVLPGLSAGLMVLTYDRPGHGETPRGVRGPELPADTEHLAELLRELDLFPVHIGAHASGAALVVRLADEHPELVRSLLLHEPPFLAALGEPAPEGGGREAIDRALRKGQQAVRGGGVAEAARSYLAVFGAAAEQWEHLHGRAREIWSANARAWADELDDPGFLLPELSALDRLDVPVLLTAGARSPPWAGELSRRVGERLRNGTRIELTDAGHLPHVFAPETLAGLWTTFLLDRQVPPS